MDNFRQHGVEDEQRRRWARPAFRRLLQSEPYRPPARRRMSAAQKKRHAAARAAGS
jgi:hypothetical protein